MFNRRCLIAGAAALGGCAGLAPLVAAFANGSSGNAFHSALQQDARLLGWKTPAADRLDCPSLVVEGTLPPDLRGVLYRNGPAIHDRHGLRYRHWFDGDAMLQEFRFDGQHVSHRGRVLQTPKLAHEDAAGRRLYDAFDTHIADGAPVRRPDDVNPANISVLDHHGKLMALWEAGSASVIDRDRLAWQGFQVWGDGLAGVPFTAHPKVEADGTLWAFGCATGSSPALVLYRIAADGRLVKVALVPLEPMGMVHDFVVTERHLVIVVPPFVHDPERAGTFLGNHAWQPDIGTRVLVVAKDDFDQRRWYQLPAAFGFHHGNGWEERDGTIRYDHCVAEDPGLVTAGLRDVMAGALGALTTERYASFALHRSGRTEVFETAEPAEFPAVSPATVGRRNRYVYTLGVADGASWYFRTVAKRDLERGFVECFDYGAGIVAEEHVFVPSPRARSEDDGYLVGTFLAYERGVGGIGIFDAGNIADGPLARAWLPYPLPLGFHGRFTAA